MKDVFMRFPNFRDRALTLSYDDGVQSDLRLISIMQEHGLKGTFNLNSGCFAPEGKVYPAGTVHRRMSRSEALACYVGSGMEVAVHGEIHPHWNTLPLASATLDIIRDRDNLEKTFHTLIRGSASPYGVTGEKCVAALKAAGIVYCRTTVATEKFSLPDNWLQMPATCHHGNPRLMELAKTFVESDRVRSPLLFYLWGHSYEFDGENNWNVIEDFAAYIGRRPEIWYATNIEIYEYCEAYERLVWSVDMDRVYNPTTTELFFLYGGKPVKIMPGETVLF